MSNHRLAIPIVAAATILSSGAIAHADLAPPPSFVPSCSVNREATKESPCESCAGDYRKPKACAQSLGKKGLTFRCRTPGRTAWSEVWCQSDDAPDDSVPKEEPDAAPVEASPSSSPAPAEPSSAPAVEPQTSGWGCAVPRPGQPKTGTILWLLALGVAWARRPRSRRPNRE